MATTVSLGSVSTGTMREEDLIPCFVGLLESLIPPESTECNDHRRAHLAEIVERMDDDKYYESDDATYDMDWLFDKLNTFAPPYCHFGAHEGDGADYGFWVCWDALEDSVHDGDLLKVADLSEVPDDYIGEVLHVNDHGNTTLYVADKGKLTEVWSVV